MDSTELVVAAALLVRLLAPLWMLRRPLPGMLAALGADIFDGVLLEGLPGFDAEDKHPYDKPLDTYYLAIAYVVVLRSWTCPQAVRIARALWYWRLVGVTAYLLTDDRAVFFLCPAAFEFFFLAFEAARGRATMAGRGTPRVGLLAGAAVVLKLPQEYWLHVAQAPSTSLVTHHVLGADPSTTRLQLAADYAMWVLLAVAIAGIARARRGAAVGRSSAPRSRQTTKWRTEISTNGTRPVEEGATAAVACSCVALALNALSTTTAQPHPLAVGLGIAVAAALVAALGGWLRSSA